MANKNLRQAKKLFRRRGGTRSRGGASRRRRLRRGGRSWRPAVDYFNLELVSCQQIDAPGQMFIRWNDATGGYVYDEQHLIAQRIGPEMQPFVAGLSSDPDYFRGKAVLGEEEICWSFVACFCLGPLALF